jgi:hypothetical protein
VLNADWLVHTPKNILALKQIGIWLKKYKINKDRVKNKKRKKSKETKEKLKKEKKVKIKE